MSQLIEQTQALLAEAEKVFSSSAQACRDVVAAQQRFDGPLRVAIAGRVKAGKSTLLNALVGDRLAPTDTSECTKVVTWYRNGDGYGVDLYAKKADAPVRALFSREDSAIDIDLGGRTPTEVDKLVVTWPSKRLARLTLIDTPGVDTLSTQLEKKTFDFLDPQDTDTPADAVLYLMKHIHASDISLLEAFHDNAASQPNPVNAVAILARADEIAGGRVDAMASARKIAKRYGDDKKLRRLVQLVLPVAGLLAETAATMTEREFGWLQALAETPTRELEPHLLSVDRFVEADPGTPLTSLERKELLDRFGLYGIRQALAMLRSQSVSTSSALAQALSERSGVETLRQALETLFVGRAEVLKARSALLCVERLCAENPHIDGVDWLSAETERIVSNAHPFNELAAIAALRAGWLQGKEADLRSLEQVLGSSGTELWQRLELDQDATDEQITAQLSAALTKWRRLAENPLVSHDLVSAIRVAVRSLEGALAGLNRL